MLNASALRLLSSSFPRLNPCADAQHVPAHRLIEAHDPISEKHYRPIVVDLTVLYPLIDPMKKANIGKRADLERLDKVGLDDAALVKAAAGAWAVLKKNAHTTRPAFFPPPPPPAHPPPASVAPPPPAHRPATPVSPLFPPP